MKKFLLKYSVYRQVHRLAALTHYSLKEVYGCRLPIIMANSKPSPLHLKWKNQTLRRLHDLLKNVIDNLGGTITEIIIDELKRIHSIQRLN